MEKDILMVKGMDGRDIRLFVIDIIQDTETNKEYIYYTVDGSEDVLVSRLVQTESGYSFESVNEDEKNILVEAIKYGRR